MGRPTQLRCPKCSATFTTSAVRNLCDCGAPLLVDYDLAALKGAFTTASLAGRTPDMWRYWEVLPVVDRANVVSLGEGFTPACREAWATMYGIVAGVMKKAA